MPLAPRIINDANIRNAFQATNKYVHTLAFKKYISTSEMFTDANTIYFGSIRAAGLNFTVTDKKAAISFPRPTFWVKGLLTYTILFEVTQAPTGGDETVYLKTDIYGHALADVLATGGTQIFTLDGLITLTAVGLQTVSNVTTVEVDSSHKLVSFSIERDISEDDFTGGFYLVGITIEYHPANLQ